VPGGGRTALSTLLVHDNEHEEVLGVRIIHDMFQGRDTFRRLKRRGDDRVLSAASNKLRNLLISTIVTTVFYNGHRVEQADHPARFTIFSMRIRGRSVRCALSMVSRSPASTAAAGMSWLRSAG
jgi:hypothetical protein